jgi:hypothetical protein
MHYNMSRCRPATESTGDCQVGPGVVTLPSPATTLVGSYVFGECSLPIHYTLLKVH